MPPDSTAKTDRSLSDVLRSDPQLQAMLSGFLLFAFCAAIFGYLQFQSPGLPGIMGYYHVKMAQIMRLEGLTPEFIWLPLTSWNPSDYYEHYFLHQVYLSLFITNPATASPLDLIVAAELASIIAPTLVFMMVWWTLHRQGVRLAWLWTLGLFALSSDFLYRMGMGRSFVFGLLWMVVGLHLMMQKKFRWLILIGWVFVWTYDGFPMLIAFAGLYTLAAFLADGEIEWRPLVYALIGVALGLVINLYFPRNLQSIFLHLTTKLNPIQLSEWKRAYPDFILKQMGPSLLLLAAGIGTMIAGKRRPDRITITALLISLFTGAMSLYAIRFIEYFPVFVLIFAALTLPYLANLIPKRIPALVPRVILIGVMIGGGGYTLNQATLSYTSFGFVEMFEGAGRWLSANAEPGELIYNVHMDSFFGLHFYNPNNAYISGMSPEFLEQQNPELSDLYRSIDRGEVTDPAALIGDEFGARYVVLLNGYVHQDIFDADPLLTMVYSDQNVAIYELSE